MHATGTTTTWSRACCSNWRCSWCRASGPTQKSLSTPPQSAGTRRSDRGVPGRTCCAERCRVPGAVRRLTDHAHRPRLFRAQCADRDRQLRCARVGGDCEPDAVRPYSCGGRSRGVGARKPDARCDSEGSFLTPAVRGSRKSTLSPRQSSSTHWNRAGFCQMRWQASQPGMVTGPHPNREHIVENHAKPLTLVTALKPADRL
jgi:hypothetical protein